MCWCLGASGRRRKVVYYNLLGSDHNEILLCYSLPSVDATAIRRNTTTAAADAVKLNLTAVKWKQVFDYFCLSSLFKLSSVCREHQSRFWTIFLFLFFYHSIPLFSVETNHRTLFLVHLCNKVVVTSSDISEL